MLIITIAANDEPVERLLGCIGCEHIAPVADYSLVSASSSGDTVVTTLADYSRWTEPAYGPVASLVRLHPRDATAAAPGWRLHSTIYLGRNLQTARPIERLDARIVEGSLHASVQDEFGVRHGKQPARNGYTHALDMLEHAARLALWLADTEPPIPPPLTEVPVQDDGGQPYVLATDIPEFPSRFFEQRRLGRTVPMPGAYYAHDWWHFIGGRP